MNKKNRALMREQVQRHHIDCAAREVKRKMREKKGQPVTIERLERTYRAWVLARESEES